MNLLGLKCKRPHLYEVTDSSHWAQMALFLHLDGKQGGTTDVETIDFDEFYDEDALPGLFHFPKVEMHHLKCLD